MNGYDPFGRLNTVAWDIGNQADTAAYTYVPDSDLLAGYTTAGGQVTSYTWEDHRDLKTSVANAHSTALISEYAYGNDPLGRRTFVKNTGQAFTQDAFNRYDYNSRNEVIGSERYLGNDIEDLTTPVAPEQRLYQYDPIGNRETAATGTAPAIDYTANSLNQYTAVGARSLSYDADGNLIEKDGMTCTWNAENRLTSVAPASPSDGDTRVGFVYDYQGRRVKKTVYTYDAFIPEWTETTTRLFVYNGWNLIQELDETGTVQKSYAWGHDLSQSLQGAGGVGGLLAATDGTATWYYCHDANGNVGQMIHAETGTIAAAYQYDPFGRLTSSSGDRAEENAFRFSTKYRDNETGFYYYGYRYYDVEMGRWINRDPLDEHGGYNLYTFVVNNPVSLYDFIGLAQVTDNLSWESPYIYYKDTMTGIGTKNYGTYNIDFKIQYDNQSGAISKVEVFKEGLKEYWQYNTDEGLSFGIYRSPIEYTGCKASFEQELTVTTRDAGELLSHMAKGLIKKSTPGGKIKKFILKKSIDKLFEAYNEEFMFHKGTLKTSFNIKVKNGSVVFDPDPPEEIERTGDRLRFQDNLESYDQDFMNLELNELRIRLQVMQIPQEDINRLMEKRKEWK